jgi:hypothetical protein
MLEAAESAHFFSKKLVWRVREGIFLTLFTVSSRDTISHALQKYDPKWKNIHKTEICNCKFCSVYAAANFCLMILVSVHENFVISEIKISEN